MEQDGCILIDSDEEEERPKGWSAEDMEEILQFVDTKNWYSISVEDSMRHSKEDILTALLESITPADFVPVMTESGEYGVRKMYATKCEKAIKKISSLGFQFYCKNDPTNPIRVKVNHNDPPPKKINPLKIIYDAILLRFTKSCNKLDLVDFKNDFMLRGKIYFPLWYPGNQRLVTILIKALSLTPSIHILDLSENGITSVSDFNIPVVFSNVHTLNLSRNKIKSFEGFRCLQGNCNKITNLNIDGNDLCSDFVGEWNYITCVKMIFPSLNVLDDKVLSKGGLPGVRRNYTIDWDALPLVDKFMETYFTLFDSKQRDRLFLMYSPKAILTVSGDSKFDKFIPPKKHRNLLVKGIFTKVYEGGRAINTYLASMPQTLHDPLSFHVDIVLHSSLLTVFHIQGVFKVPASNVSDDEPMIEFMRTFAISSMYGQGCNSNNYKICNDMFSFAPATELSCKEAFKHVPVISNKLSLESLEKYLTEPVVNGVIQIFIRLTEFPYLEAKECLERNKWNLRTALIDAISILEKERILST